MRVRTGQVEQQIPVLLRQAQATEAFRDKSGGVLNFFLKVGFVPKGPLLMCPGELGPHLKALMH